MCFCCIHKRSLNISFGQIQTTRNRWMQIWIVHFSFDFSIVTFSTEFNVEQLMFLFDLDFIHLVRLRSLCFFCFFSIRTLKETQPSRGHESMFTCATEIEIALKEKSIIIVRCSEWTVTYVYHLHRAVVTVRNKQVHKLNNLASYVYMNVCLCVCNLMRAHPPKSG